MHKRQYRYWTKHESYLIRSKKISDGELSKMFNCSLGSIRQYRSKHNKHKRAPTNKNLKKDFFDHWSKESAYIAGFTCADGYFNTNKNNHMIGWGIHPRDEYILYQFKEIMGSDLPIRKYKHKYDFYIKRISRLEIHSKEYCAAFQKMGIPTTRKTYRIRIPKMPKKYLPDFVRGYFDGDGCVCIGETVTRKGKIRKEKRISIDFTSCSKKFLSELNILFSKLCSMKTKTINKITGKNACRLKLRGWQAIKIGHWMYTDSKLFLKRKKKIWDRAFTMEFPSRKEYLEKHRNLKTP